MKRILSENQITRCYNSDVYDLGGMTISEKLFLKNHVFQE